MRSDQFSAGAVLWEALAGVSLFEGSSDTETYARVRTAKVPHLRSLRNDVPKQLAAAIHRALHADPAKRFASVRDMARELGSYFESSLASGGLAVSVGGEHCGKCRGGFCSGSG